MILRRSESAHAQFYPHGSPEARRICLILLVIGLLPLLILLPITIHHGLIQEDLVEVEAVVERSHGGRRNTSVFVSYEYNGETYEMVPYKSWHPGLVEGSSITLKLHPNKPDRIVSNLHLFFLTADLIYLAFAAIIWFKCHDPLKRQHAPAPSPQAYERPRERFDRPFGSNW